MNATDWELQEDQNQQLRDRVAALERAVRSQQRLIEYLVCVLEYTIDWIRGKTTNTPPSRPDPDVSGEPDNG